MRKIPETISEEELIKMLQDKGKKQEKHKASWMLGFYEAMRVSEIVNLAPDNIDRQQHLIKIKQGKGNKDRNIPIVKPLLLNEAQIFKALNQVPINLGIRALEIAFKKKAKEVLGKDLHFHTLRHSGATWLLNKKKWDIRQVQQFLGHSKIQTTEIYTHVSPQDLINLEWGDTK